MTIGDYNGDDEFNVGDVTGWWGLSNQRRLIEQQSKSNELLTELAAEQRRLQSLPICPACRKPVEIHCRLCGNCRSSISWVGDKELFLPAIKGEEQNSWRDWYRLKGQLETEIHSSALYEIDTLVCKSKALAISFWIVLSVYLALAIMLFSSAGLLVLTFTALSLAWFVIYLVARAFVSAD